MRVFLRSLLLFVVTTAALVVLGLAVAQALPERSEPTRPTAPAEMQPAFPPVSREISPR